MFFKFPTIAQSAKNEKRKDKKKRKEKKKKKERGRRRKKVGGLRIQYMFFNSGSRRKFEMLNRLLVGVRSMM
jgi:hypothetical protein